MRWAKTSIKILAATIALLLVLYLALAGYVVANKRRVLSTAIDQVNAHISGSLTVGHADIEAVPRLPGIAIALNNVLIRDSMWQQHGQTLLKARKLYITLNPLSLITGKPRLGRIDIAHGEVNIFTDSTGYSNTSALRRGEKKSGGNTPDIDNVFMDDVELKIAHQQRAKLFHFGIRQLHMRRSNTRSGWTAKLDMHTMVHSMVFNEAKGSFLQGKTLRAKLTCHYNSRRNELTIPLQPLDIDRERISASGKFSFSEGQAPVFDLFFGSEAIQYKTALSFITPGISKKIDMLNLERPVTVRAALHGRTAYRDTPYVRVSWQVKDNTFTTPAGTVKNCSFAGTYINERIPGGGHKDPNALITVTNLAGNWEGIALRVDTMSITDLINPILEGALYARTGMDKLNKVAGESDFSFGTGQLLLDVRFKGGLKDADTARPYIRGRLNLTDGTMTYRPLDMKLSNMMARIRFTGDGVIADTLAMTCGNSNLAMNGHFEHFLTLFYTSPREIVMNWNVSSKLIDLTELVPLLRMRQARATPAPTATRKTIPQQLGDVIAGNRVNLDVKVDKVVYQNFAATGIRGTLEMDTSRLALTNMSLQHAGGRIDANATITRLHNLNHYDLKAVVNGVSVSRFFKAFDNFGQDAITDDVISGTLTTDAQVRGTLLPDGTPVKQSINGEVAITLNDGAIVNFAPFKVIGGLLLRKRHMDSVAFRDIQTRLTLSSGRITVPPLHIESNAINMMVKGVYATAGPGTNLDVDVPLRNPGKDSMIKDETLRHERHSRGIVVRLKATKDDDGKLRIRLRGKK